MIKYYRVLVHKVPLSNTGSKSLDRGRSRSTECLEESYSALDNLSTRAQSTQDLSRGNASQSSKKFKSAKMDKYGQDVLLSRTGTTKRKDVPFSVKCAVSPIRTPSMEYCVLEVKIPSGKSKPTTDLLDQMLMQIKASLVSFQFHIRRYFYLSAIKSVHMIVYFIHLNTGGSVEL